MLVCIYTKTVALLDTGAHFDLRCGEFLTMKPSFEFFQPSEYG